MNWWTKTAAFLAETWCGARVHPRAASLFGSVDGFPKLDEKSARQVGTLLAISNTADIVDGNVLAIAMAQPPATIVTSDVSDITELLAGTKVPHALFGGRVPAAAQVIIVKV